MTAPIQRMIAKIFLLQIHVMQTDMALTDMSEHRLKI